MRLWSRMTVRLPLPCPLIVSQLVLQDAFSRFTLGGCGDGFPRWALPANVVPAAPDNSLQNCSKWGPRLTYDQDTRRVFEAFFK
jgi:endoglycosylceramidase